MKKLFSTVNPPVDGIILSKGQWLPQYLISDKTLKLNRTQKTLLLLVWRLDTTTAGCRVSNNFLSQAVGITERQVRRALSSLIAAGFVVFKSYNGRLRALKITPKARRFFDTHESTARDSAASTQKTLEKKAEDKRPPHTVSVNGSQHTKNERKYTEEQLNALLTDIDDVDF